MISVTDEEVGLVNDFIAAYQVTHPVVILKGGELEKLIGVQGFPTSAVFSNGELQWTGHPSSSGSAVAKALKQAKKGSVFPRALAKAGTLIRANQPAQAYAEVLKLEAKLSPEDAAWAGRVKTFLAEESVAAHVAGKADVEAGFTWRGLDRARRFAGEGSALPNAKEVDAWIAAVEAGTAELKKELAGGPLYAEAEGLAKAYDFVGAVKAYKSVMSKCRGTRIAANALSAAQALVSAGSCGFNPSCEKCDHKALRACAKHREDVKL